MTQLTDNTNTKKKLLLHICCGPCAEYPVEVLRPDYDITLFFYNPNIHPRVEWYRRLEGAKKLAEIKGLPLIVHGGFNELPWRDLPDDAYRRCGYCYGIRLRRTAEFAAAEGFDYIGTTLSVSPYQDFDRMKKIGDSLAAQFGLTYIPDDFRPGFREGQRMAREDGIYRQKYCGCCISFSESDFYEKVVRQHESYEIPADLAVLDPTSEEVLCRWTG